MGNVQRIHELLREMPVAGLPALQQLLWTELGFGRVHERLPVREWTTRMRSALASGPVILARRETPMGAFDVIYTALMPAEVDQAFPLSVTAERLVASQLLRDHRFALFAFSDPDQRYWHLAHVVYEHELARRQTFRRIAIGPHKRLSIVAERMALFDLANLERQGLPLSLLDIQRRLEQVFDVEAVTTEFLENCQRIVRDLWLDLGLETGNERKAGGFALQFLSRLLFLCFAQGSHWRGGDPLLLEKLWLAYRQAGGPKDTFVSGWLWVLFNAALGGPCRVPYSDLATLPAGLGEALVHLSRLDIRILECEDQGRSCPYTIRDDRFENVLEFLRRYDFAVNEDAPLDREVALDPEIIGRLCESLAQPSESVDGRGGMGVYYTPRVEIDLMCRLAMVDWLTNHLGHRHRPLLNEAVFALSVEQKDAADSALAERKLWPTLRDLFGRVTILDPTCGSGSFLIGMLRLLDDLVARANRQTSTWESTFERRRQIIQNNLFGVDVKTPAIEIARMRLLLQLTAVGPDGPLTGSSCARFPDLSTKVRCGDSLVQELDGLALNLHRHSAVRNPAWRERVGLWKAEKLEHDASPRKCQRKPRQKRQEAERQLLSDFLELRARDLNLHVGLIADRLRLVPGNPGESHSAGREQSCLEQECERLEGERDLISRARKALQKAEHMPFVWYIAFLEVFESGAKGFDIVVGNPPYVRQELIFDPQQSPESVTARARGKYKAKLARAVYSAWPRAFGFDSVRQTARRRLSARGDLYIYCYLHGLSLLGNKGTCCFVTSNAWLDAAYGRDLQEFLLTRGHVKLIVENEAHRSFAHAEVNTVIALLGTAHDTVAAQSASLQRLARFATLTIPFERAFRPEIWQQLDSANSRQMTPELRVFPVKQSVLLESGMNSQRRRFKGDKWGGKYLRAPDIYWVILEKAGDRMVRLGSIAKVRRGVTTGANGFFFLDEEQRMEWGLEEDFLVPALQHARDCTRIWLEHSDNGEQFLFMCHKERRELEGTRALEYIRYGEREGFDRRPTCQSRPRWWDLGVRFGTSVCCNYLVHRVMRFHGSSEPFLVGDNFQEVHSKIEPELMVAACNSTICQLSANILGRSNFGGGLLKVQTYEVADLMIPNPLLLDAGTVQLVRNMGLLDLEDPVRYMLDDMVFAILGLTEGEREGVYEAVGDLVTARLRKATDPRPVPQWREPSRTPEREDRKASVRIVRE